MSWDDIEGLYSEIDKLSRQNDWAGLEQTFFQYAEKNSGLELARLIQSVDIEGYIKALSIFLDYECKRLSHHAVKALYFEYDLANDWRSNLFICDRYSPSSSGNDDWARHSIDRAVGPGLPDFARIYKQYGGFHVENPQEIAITFYLIARTVAAYGKAIYPVPTHKMKVCIGHLDQVKITRIYA